MYRNVIFQQNCNINSTFIAEDSGWGDQQVLQTNTKLMFYLSNWPMWFSFNKRRSLMSMSHTLFTTLIFSPRGFAIPITMLRYFHLCSCQTRVTIYMAAIGPFQLNVKILGMWTNSKYYYTMKNTYALILVFFPKKVNDIPLTITSDIVVPLHAPVPVASSWSCTIMIKSNEARS